MTDARERIVSIYADESCLGNQFRDTANPGGAAGMVEIFDPKRGWHRRDYYHHDPNTTNNRMALMSAIVGLRSLRRPCDIIFTSDSQYLVRGMTEWIHRWAARGWRRKGGQIENLDLWQELAAEAARHRIEWRWIRGHSEHVKNEYANMLATRTAAEGKSSDGLIPSGFSDWIEAEIDEGRFTDFLDLPPAESFEPVRPPPAVDSPPAS
jgi:ribonuclease HI